MLLVKSEERLPLKRELSAKLTEELKKLSHSMNAKVTAFCVGFLHNRCGGGVRLLKNKGRGGVVELAVLEGDFLSGEAL